MKFGVYGPADVSTIERSVRAEQLGYDWVAFSDSPMQFSDVFATMALAAQATKKLTIGASVAAVGIRLPTVAAAAFATINKVAPGRVFAGFGTGLTSFGLMGVRSPIKQAELAEYVRVVRGLLAGDEVEFALHGESKPTRFLMADRGFVNVEDSVPIYLAAHGPKGQILAGEIADGVVEGWGDFPDIDDLKQRLHAGAHNAGRQVDNFAIFTPKTIIMIEPGEDLTSERVIEEAGSRVAIRLHTMYMRFGHLPADEMPPLVAPFWDDYRKMMQAWHDPRTFHYRAFAGHQTFVHPDERRFITPAMIEANHVVAAPGELIEILHEWEAAGVTHVSISGTDACIDEKMDRFARLVLAKL